MFHSDPIELCYSHRFQRHMQWTGALQKSIFFLLMLILTGSIFCSLHCLPKPKINKSISRRRKKNPKQLVHWFGDEEAKEKGGRIQIVFLKWKLDEYWQTLGLLVFFFLLVLKIITTTRIKITMRNQQKKRKTLKAKTIGGRKEEIIFYDQRNDVRNEWLCSIIMCHNLLSMQ